MSGKINNGKGKSSARHSTKKNTIPQIETQPSASTSSSTDTVSALVSHGNTSTEIRVSIIGKTGVGKSALGNALLQQDTFKSQQQPTSVTSECGLGQRHLQLNGVDSLLKVVDTPGLFDTGNSNKTIAKEIVKCINILSPGPHLFIFVFRIDLRLSQEDIKVLEYFKNTFGELIDKFAVVVFTGKDHLRNRSEEEAMHELHTQLSTFSDVFKHRRYATINNIDETEGKMKDVNRILQLLQTTIQNNGGDFYENEMYEEAKKLFEARICDEEDGKQKALAERDELKKEQIRQEQIWQKEKEQLTKQCEKQNRQEQIWQKERGQLMKQCEKQNRQEQIWQEEKEQLLKQWTEERAKLIEDTRKKEIDLDKREMEIQLLERERQSTQWLSSTSRQSYTELASTSTFHHGSSLNTLNISRAKKRKYEPSRRERGKMFQEDEKNIKDNYAFLLDNITDPERLSDRLFGKSVFDTDDMEKIKDVKGKRAMTRELVNTLLNGGPNSYQSFIDSLKEEGYTTIVEQLESSRDESHEEMIRGLGDRNQLMLGGIDEHYDVSYSEVGNRSEIHKDHGEVDVVKVVVKKANNTVILSKVKSDHQKINVKQEIISTCRRNVKNIANCVLYENQDSMFNDVLEDEQEDHVKTTDIAVDMTARTSDPVGLAIKQEPLEMDGTYGVTQPTIMSSNTRPDTDDTDHLLIDEESKGMTIPDDVKYSQTSIQNNMATTITSTTPLLNQPFVTQDVITTNYNKTTDNNKMDWESIRETCEYGTLDDVKTLIHQNIDLNIPLNDYNQTPVFFCVLSDKQPVDKIQLLFSAGAMLHVKNRYGNSLLHCACLWGTIDCVKYLLEQGLDTNDRNDGNETPVFYCVMSNKQSLDKIQLLFSAGAMLHVKGRYGSLLDYARLWRRKECVSYLRELGLDK
ncbi:protein Daple [Patella vulgata]|uniref:protein Daple n=1 Tax=Patella vulgata TaxID=6465 RepID=UPI0024A8945C|nr:protein Daple [Patella vulgata]XP_055954980.1 protein Daple [Patella vulgata]XP_055954981.1 protein Daple [Patella vulgata]XP_055954982.1 protein Daple [Patella vulgata]XP_055954983.1 protein Daple [Patella vulgata]